MRTSLPVLALAVTQLAAPPPAQRAVWDWPLSPRPAVVRAFAPGRHNWEPGHRGADLAGRPGVPVRAVAAGKVVFAGRIAGRGVVSVEHPDGRRSTYEPVAATVRRGDPVARAQHLGTLLEGHAGCPAPACLHLGLLVGADSYADPVPLMTRTAVLLPPRREEQQP